MGNASPEPAQGPESRAAALKSSLPEPNPAPCASSKWVGRSSPASAGAQKVPTTLPRAAAFSPRASSVRESRTRSGAGDSASPAPHPSPALTRGLADPSSPSSQLQGTPPGPAALQGMWAGSTGGRGPRPRRGVRATFGTRFRCCFPGPLAPRPESTCGIGTGWTQAGREVQPSSLKPDIEETCQTVNQRPSGH